MLVVAIVLLLTLIVVALSWYTWRLFGSFRVESKIEHEEQTGVLERLTDAQEELVDATENLTRQLELLKVEARRRTR